MWSLLVDLGDDGAGRWDEVDYVVCTNPIAEVVLVYARCEAEQEDQIAARNIPECTAELRVVDRQDVEVGPQFPIFSRAAIGGICNGIGIVPRNAGAVADASEDAKAANPLAGGDDAARQCGGFGGGLCPYDEIARPDQFWPVELFKRESGARFHDDYARSKIAAMPCPPPTHMVSRP